MPLSAGAANQGATINRLLNRLNYAMSNDAEDITTAATGDYVMMLDASDNYEIKYADATNVAELISGSTVTALTVTTLTATTGNFTNIDAGASGTAGTVDVFPSTASKGKLQIAVTDQTGDTTVTLQIGAMAAARTITLRDPGAAATIVTTTDTTGTAITSTVAELNKLDDSVVALSKGAGVSATESYGAGTFQNGSFWITRLIVDLTGLVGSATDLDIIGNTGGAASAHWGQITAALSGTLVGGQVTCLEVPAGGADDIDFYSATVSTGAQDGAIGDLTETALLTRGAAWAAGDVKPMTGLPPANDYLYIVNGEAVGGTYTAGKFLIEFFGKT